MNNSTTQPSTTDQQPAKGDLREQTLNLNWQEWLIVAAVMLPALYFLPHLNRRAAPILADLNYRTPTALSEDYWLFDQFTKRVDFDDEILVFGDSVIWGEFVPRQETLAQQLIAQRTDRVFRNAAVKGLHPLAMSGLVEDYADGVRNRRVIVHCNPIWMSSLERDLQTKQDGAFNQPKLLPQFDWRIKAYSATVEKRTAIAVERKTPLFGWAQHLRYVHCDGEDYPRWSLDEPYDFPKKLSMRFDEESEGKEVSWIERRIQPIDLPWLDLQDSLQWQAFQRTLRLLKARGNRVFVIVGPVNEHMLQQDSLRRYQALLAEIETALWNDDTPHLVLSLLPSDEYADLSHPLSAGYKHLAEQIVISESFENWLR